jgi:hypothetical protein
MHPHMVSTAQITVPLAVSPMAKIPLIFSVSIYIETQHISLSFFIIQGCPFLINIDENNCHYSILSGEQLGAAEPTMPYLSPHLAGEKLLIGANFASAGIGVLNDTGFQFVSEYPLFFSFYFLFSYVHPP